MNSLKNFLQIEKYCPYFLGRIALEQGLIETSRLVETLRIQHRNPTYKIGEIFIEEKSLTKYQLDSLLQTQKKLLEHKLATPSIPNTLLKSIVYFQTIVTAISFEKMEQAQEVLNESLLEETKPSLLIEILVKQLKTASADDLRFLCTTMAKSFGLCPHCKRKFTLLNPPQQVSICCPCCWNIDIVIGPTKDLALPEKLSLREEISQLQKIELYNSEEFLSVYKTLKKIKPLNQQQLLLNTAGQNSIAVVFEQLTVQYSQSTMDSVAISLEELEEQEEQKSKAQPQKLITLGPDMAQTHTALKQKMVNAQEVIYAFFAMAKMPVGQRKKVMEILKERKAFSIEQKEILDKVKSLKVPKVKFQLSSLEDQVYQHINEYQILSKKELQTVIDIQIKLSYLGLNTTLEDILIASRLLGKDMIAAIFALCQKKLEEKKGKLEKQVISKEKRLLQSKYNQRNRRSLFFNIKFLLILFVILYIAMGVGLQKSKKRSEESFQKPKREKATRFVMKPAKKVAVIQPKKEEIPIKNSPTKNFDEELTKEIKEELKTSVPQMLAHIQSLQTYVNDFLKSHKLMSFLINIEKWQIAWQKIYLQAPADGNYDRTLKAKIEVLGKLNTNLTSLVQNLVFYIEDKEGECSEKSFKELIKSCGQEKNFNSIKETLFRLQK